MNTKCVYGLNFKNWNSYINKRFKTDLKRYMKISLNIQCDKNSPLKLLTNVIFKVYKKNNYKDKFN